MEHVKLATFCFTYLTSGPFSSKISESHIVSRAEQGYYALQDYTVKYWFDHLIAFIDSGLQLDGATITETLQAAQNFVDTYSLSPNDVEKGDGEKQARTIGVLRGLPKDERERTRLFSIEHYTVLLRRVIEKVRNQPASPGLQPKVLTRLYGTGSIYKCPKPWCEHFTRGFNTDQERKTHTNCHDLPHICPIETCFAHSLGFSTQRNLENHKRTHHSDSDGALEFPGRRVSQNRKPQQLWEAAKNGDLAQVTALLDLGRDPDESWLASPLFLAAEEGHFNVCKLLIERGAAIDSRSKSFGSTPLHAAVNSNSLHILQLMMGRSRGDSVVYDADYDALHNDYEGRSPLYLACYHGFLDIVKLLCEADYVTFRPRSRISALSVACAKGHTEIMQYWLQQDRFEHTIDEIEKYLKESVANDHHGITLLLRPVLDRLSSETAARQWWKHQPVDISLQLEQQMAIKRNIEEQKKST